MKRLFWVGIGVAAAVYGARWIRRQRARMSPAAIGTNLSDVATDVRRLFKTSVEEARRAAAEKEAELRGDVLDTR